MERALALTEPLLDPRETRSAAAQIRALTLRGAQVVLANADEASRLQAELAERYGAMPGRGDLLDLEPLASERQAVDPAPATRALQWVRGE